MEKKKFSFLYLMKITWMLSISACYVYLIFNGFLSILHQNSQLVVKSIPRICYFLFHVISFLFLFSKWLMLNWRVIECKVHIIQWNSQLLGYYILRICCLFQCSIWFSFCSSNWCLIDWKLTKISMQFSSNSSCNHFHI